MNHPNKALFWVTASEGLRGTIIGVLTADATRRFVDEYKKNVDESGEALTPGSTIGMDSSLPEEYRELAEAEWAALEPTATGSGSTGSGSGDSTNMSWTTH